MFLPHSIAGRTLILLSPDLPKVYPDGTFVTVVLGRMAIIKLRGTARPALDVCAVHSVASAFPFRIRQLQLLRGCITLLRSDVVFSGTVLEHEVAVSHGILQVCPASGSLSLWPTLAPILSFARCEPLTRGHRAT